MNRKRTDLVNQERLFFLLISRSAYGRPYILHHVDIKRGKLQDGERDPTFLFVQVTGAAYNFN